MDFIPKEIAEYAERFTRPEGALLAELDRDTWGNVLYPRMLSGHLQGQVLRMFVGMVRPSTVLEVGTYTGYSALCMAEAMPAGGMLHTIDVNPELEDMVRSYIGRSGMQQRITFHVGDAREVIPAISGTFDLVFIDADKENYAQYFDLVIGRMRPGGVIIADNVLWSGKVTGDPEKMDAETRGLHAFNQKVHADPRVENVLLPVRDGLMVCRVI